MPVDSSETVSPQADASASAAGSSTPGAQDEKTETVTDADSAMPSPAAQPAAGKNENAPPLPWLNAPTAPPEPGPPPVKKYDLSLPDGRKLRLDGVDVFLMEKDGALTPAPDETYITTDGKILPTRDGQIYGLR